MNEPRDFAPYKGAILKQFNNLSLRSFKFINDGQDFYMFEINKELMFRFPSSRRTFEKLKMETTLLSKIDSSFPVRTPEYIHQYFDDSLFSFVAYKKIEGRPFDISGRVSGIDHTAAMMGHILIWLRDFSVLTPQSVAHYQKKWCDYFANLIIDIQTRALPILPASLKNSVEQIIADGSEQMNTIDFVPSLINSDLKCNHVICDEDNRIVGLTDWGDATYGSIDFEMARILSEFGFVFLEKIQNGLAGKLQCDMSNVYFYSTIIPFLTIIRGIDLNDSSIIRLGIRKLVTSTQLVEA